MRLIRDLKRKKKEHLAYIESRDALTALQTPPLSTVL
jgi:hypothetical protein